MWKPTDASWRQQPLWRVNPCKVELCICGVSQKKKPLSTVFAEWPHSLLDQLPQQQHERVPHYFLLWVFCHKSPFYCCWRCGYPYRGDYCIVRVLRKESGMLYGDDASTFRLLLLIPEPSRDAVFVDRCFQYLLKLSTVLGRASLSVEIVTECMHRVVSNRIIL